MCMCEEEVVDFDVVIYNDTANDIKSRAATAEAARYLPSARLLHPRLQLQSSLWVSPSLQNRLGLAALTTRCQDFNHHSYEVMST